MKSDFWRGRCAELCSYRQSRNMVPICELWRSGQGLWKLRSQSTALSLNKINYLKDRFWSLPTKSHLSFERQNTICCTDTSDTGPWVRHQGMCKSSVYPRIQRVRLNSSLPLNFNTKELRGLKSWVGKKDKKKSQGRQKICILGSGFLSWDGGASIFKEANFVFSSPMKRGQRSCSHTSSKRLKNQNLEKTENGP